MAVVVLSGEAFDGVVHGNAPGSGHGYVIGFNAIYDLLTVNSEDLKAGMIGVKYFHHEVGEERASVPEADKDFALTMLVGPGCWRQRVWSEASGRSVEVLLTEAGDYIAWGGAGLKHWWAAIHRSTMLTVRWHRRV